MLIAIEIGGTKLQLALGREDGTIVKTVRGRVKAEDGAQGILAWFDAQTSALLQEYGGGGNGQAEDPVRAIGVGFGGPLETATGTVLKSVQIKGWDNFSLKKWFEDRFGIPTFSRSFMHFGSTSMASASIAAVGMKSAFARSGALPRNFRKASSIFFVSRPQDVSMTRMFLSLPCLSFSVFYHGKRGTKRRTKKLAGNRSGRYPRRYFFGNHPTSSRVCDTK